MRFFWPPWLAYLEVKVWWQIPGLSGSRSRSSRLRLVRKRDKSVGMLRDGVEAVLLLLAAGTDPLAPMPDWLAVGLAGTRLDLVRERKVFACAVVAAMVASCGG